ncbi:MAG: alkaline phosphatase family protein [Verrucomicrobiae bacterium]|nr:alkaline phosphatase family protein [Verrucomicrobiae bacterium]MCP5542110.1 alkaline phosphatase family protein [Akkermansiaceae bacterium]
MKFRFFSKLVVYAAVGLLPSTLRAGEGVVIFISCDGMRPDAVTALGEEGAPHFHRLRKEGAFTDNARTDKTYTVTLPNHTSMVTSRGVVGKEGHEWIINTDPKLGQNLHRNHKAYLSSVFAVAHDNGRRTGLYASKTKFSLYDISYDERTGEPDTTGPDNGRDKIDVYHENDDTEALIGEFIAAETEKPFDFAMLHLRDCDSAGHKDSWDLTPGSPYLEAAKKVDGLIGRLLEMIDTTPALNGRTWLVITADHGGWTGTKGHGENDQPDNFTIPFYAWGPGIPGGKDLYELNSATRRDPGKENPDYNADAQPIRNGDAGNFCLSLLGLPAIPGSTINAAQDFKACVATP